MVFASSPVVSERRRAARPVGAQRAARHALGAEDAQQRVQQRRLPDARPAGHHEHLRAQGAREGVPLAARKLEAETRLDPRNRPGRVDVGPRRPALGEPRKGRRDLPLGRVQAREEDAGRTLDRVAHDRGVRELERQRLRHEIDRDLQQAPGGGHQLRLGQAAMPVVQRLGERVADAGPGPHHRRLRDPDFLRDPVGGQEADPADVAGQSVRVLADDGNGIDAVGLVDAHGAGGADAVGVKEDHDVAHGALRRASPRQCASRAAVRCPRRRGVAPARAR